MLKVSQFLALGVVATMTISCGSGTTHETPKDLSASAAVSSLPGSTVSTSERTSVNTAVSSSVSSFVLYQASPALQLAKKALSSVTFDNSSFSDPNQGCYRQLTNTTVYEQTHSIVMASEGVTEAEQQEVSDYTESAIIELRNTFSPKANIGFNGEKINVCIQLEWLNNVAGNPAGSAKNNIVITAPSVYFKRNPRDAVFRGYLHYGQDIYRRTLAHELTHSYEKSRSAYPSFYMDQWFSEGMARYEEFGKPALTKGEVLLLLAEQNPVTVKIAPAVSSEQLKDYFSAASVITYLFSPNGANNPLSAYSDLIDRVEAAWAPIEDSCRVPPRAALCTFGTSEYDHKRAEIFTDAFEAIFKEKDGTPMRLRTGTGNLQLTLSSRIAMFW